MTEAQISERRVHIGNRNGRPRKFPTRLAGSLVVAFCAGFLLQPYLPKQLTIDEFRHRLRVQLSFADLESDPPGHWHPAQDAPRDIEVTPEQRREMDRLLSLGYVGGSRPGPRRSGVTFRDSSLATDGLRLFTSGHAACAELMDPFGRILHRWQYSYEQCRRDGSDRGMIFPIDTQGVTGCWRRTRLLPGGDLLAIFEGHGLVKLDVNSRLLWSYSGHCHHDLELAPDGSIYVLSRRAAILPRIHPDQPVLLDFITHLSADGQELESIDLLAAFENSRYAPLLEFAHESGDLFHTNTLERLDGRFVERSPIFAEGNFLISLRELNTIAMVDPESEQVVWALSGMWVAQHDPTLLDNGNLLIFDNQGMNGRSRVLEIDPLSQQEVWHYTDHASGPLYSKTCGSSQRLPNGNTLITESDNGRVIEVTPAGGIVWEYRNPRRTGPEGRLIAAILEMEILPPSFPVEWLTHLP